MLVIERRQNEAFVAGDVRVVVCRLWVDDSGRPRARLGIEAPKTTVILREELVGRKPKEDGHGDD